MLSINEFINIFPNHLLLIRINISYRHFRIVFKFFISKIISIVFRDEFQLIQKITLSKINQKNLR